MVLRRRVVWWEVDRLPGNYGQAEVVPPVPSQQVAILLSQRTQVLEPASVTQALYVTVLPTVAGATV